MRKEDLWIPVLAVTIAVVVTATVFWTSQFTRAAIAFRKKHACIRRDLKAAKCGFPNVAAYAGNPWNREVTKDTGALYIVYAGYDESRKDDDIVCVCLNVFWEPVGITLPDLPEGKSWRLAMSTAGEGRGMTWKKNTMKPRSLAILAAESNRPQESGFQNDQ